MYFIFCRFVTCLFACSFENQINLMEWNHLEQPNFVSFTHINQKFVKKLSFSKFFKTIKILYCWLGQFYSVYLLQLTNWRFLENLSTFHDRESLLLRAVFAENTHYKTRHRFIVRLFVDCNWFLLGQYHNEITNSGHITAVVLLYSKYFLIYENFSKAQSLFEFVCLVGKEIVSQGQRKAFLSTHGLFRGPFESTGIFLNQDHKKG